MAIDLITEHIKMKLQQPELRRLYHNLEVMPSNYQVRGMHTLIRDRTTSKADFVFYADRLLRLVSFLATFLNHSTRIFIPWSYGITGHPGHATLGRADCQGYVKGK